jgi:hypothetical protein
MIENNGARKVISRLQRISKPRKSISRLQRISKPRKSKTSNPTRSVSPIEIELSTKLDTSPPKSSASSDIADAVRASLKSPSSTEGVSGKPISAEGVSDESIFADVGPPLKNPENPSLEKNLADDLKPPSATEPNSQDEDDEDTKADNEHEKKVKRFYKIGTVLMFAGAVVFETSHFLFTGRSFFLGTLNQAGEMTRNVNAFQNFFEENPIGQTIEGTLEFLSSKPVKRALRLILLGTAVATATTATGGAFAIAGLAVTGVSVFAFSVKEYLSERRIKKEIAINANLCELAKDIRQNHSKGLDALDARLKPIISDFVMGEGTKETPRVVEKISPEKNLLKSIAVNLLECSGSLFTGDVSDFFAIFGLGTLREFKFNQSHSDLKRAIFLTNKSLYKYINKSLGINDKEFIYFKDLSQAEEAVKKHKFAIEFVNKEDNKKITDPTAFKDKLERSYSEHCEAEKKSMKEKKSKYTFKQKVISNLKTFASLKAVEPVLGYLRSWVPYKKYSPDGEMSNLIDRKLDIHKTMLATTTPVKPPQSKSEEKSIVEAVKSQEPPTHTHTHTHTHTPPSKRSMTLS